MQSPPICRLTPETNWKVRRNEAAALSTIAIYPCDWNRGTDCMRSRVGDRATRIFSFVSFWDLVLARHCIGMFRVFDDPSSNRRKMGLSDPPVLGGGDRHAADSRSLVRAHPSWFVAALSVDERGEHVCRQGLAAQARLYQRAGVFNSHGRCLRNLDSNCTIAGDMVGRTGRDGFGRADNKTAPAQCAGSGDLSVYGHICVRLVG